MTYEEFRKALTNATNATDHERRKNYNDILGKFRNDNPVLYEKHMQKLRREFAKQRGGR